ncbi:Os10g0482601, partial [Oryza sativa Japonica Group]
LEAAATATRSSGLLPPPATASTGDDLHGNELTATAGCRCDKCPSSPLFLLYFPLVAWPIHWCWRSEMGRSGRCDGDAAPSCSSSHTRSRSSDDGDDNELLV